MNKVYSNRSTHILSHKDIETTVILNTFLALKIIFFFQHFSSPHKSVKGSGPCASRLCKAAFLHRFRDIGNALKSRQMLQAPNYLAAKRLGLKYQEAKRIFRQFCDKTGLGNWVRKPTEIDTFQK